MQQQKIQNYSNDIQLRSVIQQILKYLMEIIQAIMQEENSNNYIKFMRKNQELYQQFQIKIIKTFDIKFEAMRAELKQIIKQKVQNEQKYSNQKNFSNRELSQKQKEGANNMLKQQRKNITQSILNYHRSNSLNLPKFNEHQGQMGERQLPLFSAQQLDDDKTQLFNSLEINSFQSKLSEIEKQYNKHLKQVCIKLEAQIEQNYKEIKRLSQQNIDWRLKFEDRFDSGLEGLWNIIGNMEGKLFTLEAVVQKAKFMK